MAFHPYPQLIPSVFNLSGFAPPRRLTIASHWPWVDHPASGPGHATTTHSLVFAFATTTPHGLTSRRAADSQAHSSKGTPSPQKALTDCKHTVSGTISLPSRGTFHHSLTVLSAIGHNEYSGLPGGPGRFTADSTSPLLLGKNCQRTHCMLSRTGLSPSTAGHPRPLPLTRMPQATSCQTSPARPHNTDTATPDRYHTAPV